VTDVEQTFVDRALVLDQSVAEVVTKMHRRTGGTVDVALVRDLVEADGAGRTMPGFGPSSRSWSVVLCSTT